MYLMGTDIGTQGTKTVMVDEKGKFVSEAFREYGVITPRPSWAEQWPDIWHEAVLETLKECLERSGVFPQDVAGLAISGLYGGSGVPVDKDMKPLRPCLIWMDRRARRETQWVKDTIPLDKIFGITGNYVDSYYGFTKMMWIRNNEPEVWNKLFQFVTPKDYVVYRLTGELATDYSSAGNIGGVFDIHRREWSGEMCDLLGIPKHLLPKRITLSSELVGKLSSQAAAQTGLLEGTPVYGGGVDAPVAQLGAGVLSEGEHVAMAGTSMCWGTVHGGQYLTPGLVSFPYVVYDKERIYTFGGSATSGALARWFRDQFGGYEKEVERNTGISAYTLMELETSGIGPGSDGVLVLPYFMGERSPIWDPDARGTILGLSLFHNRNHVYRAMLEAAAYSLRHNMEEGIKAGLKLNPDCWIVGGVAKSTFWVQIFADITGFNMKRLAKDVEAPFGDAFLAGLGSGVIDSPERIKDWIEFRPLIEVNRGNQAVYTRYYELFLELYKSTKTVMKKLAEL
ncbi:MAG TPA: FGGY-family carbohydrate kinase [Atribacteraceae bacterium]|nr:FGGY-family carbohydrate kinase [Atribacteraceae bacterium]